METSTTPNANYFRELASGAKTLEELADINRRFQEWELSQADDEDAPLTDVERQRLKTEEGQEIGPLPEPANLARRRSCRNDLRLYVQTYFASSCAKGLSPYQEEMVAAFETVVLHGGKKARAVRRSGLKSTLARIATAWAIVYGHRKFPLLIGATDESSTLNRENFLKLLRESPTHTADFPELLPLLAKYANPKKGIRVNGVLQTDVTAKDSRGCIVFPRCVAGADTDHGSDMSEAHVAPYSMNATGVRGLSYSPQGGGSIRPDLLIFDDVQTDQSAHSVTMTNRHEDRVGTTFMGLAALGDVIAAIMVCTVKQDDDLSSRFLDRKQHPDWDGKRFPVLIHEPSDKKHWPVYCEKLREGATPEEGHAAATAYYLEHREEMDAGAVVAWEGDRDDGFVSSLQWAMTKASIEPELFRCELQQQGAKPPGSTIQLDPKQLVRRLSGIARGTVPSQASYLTGFVDSQKEVLYWTVVAWTSNFTGWVVDWGSWPDQGRSYFLKDDLRRKISAEMPGAAWEEAFVHAHNQLDQRLLGTDWPVEHGGTRPIDLLLKDWSEGSQRQLIGPQIMASSFRSRIRPAQGVGIKPGRKAIHLYGDIHRDRTIVDGYWIERRTTQPHHVQVDTNKAKGFLCRRLQTVIGAPSALVFPGDDERDLTMLIEHLTAEIAEVHKINEAEGIMYQAKLGRDNDLFDCVVGNTVAASMLGCALMGEPGKRKEVKTFKLPAMSR